MPSSGDEEDRQGDCGHQQQQPPPAHLGPEAAVWRNFEHFLRWKMIFWVMSLYRDGNSIERTAKEKAKKERCHCFGQVFCIGLNSTFLYRLFCIFFSSPYALSPNISGQSWALPVFFHFFNNKKLFFCTFYQVSNLFLHQSYLKSPFPVKLTW